MFLTRNMAWRWAGFTFLAAGVLGLSLTPLASAADLSRKDVKKAQTSLSDKGFNPGPADGLLGPRTRASIRQYQRSEDLPVTGRLDAQTAGKLGVGSESMGGRFKAAGHDVADGSKELGHEMKQGKPLAAGKEFGKGMGRAGRNIGRGVVKGVGTDSDRGDREEKAEDR
jgi:peptidoglycan hydrolase-like protein with peptidoglycan-binding domain